MARSSALRPASASPERGSATALTTASVIEASGHPRISQAGQGPRLAAAAIANEGEAVRPVPLDLRARSKQSCRKDKPTGR